MTTTEQTQTPSVHEPPLIGPYLVRGGSPARIVHATALFIQHAAKYRERGTVGGVFVHIEQVGVDRSRVEVRARDGVNAFGRGDGRNIGRTVAKTAAGIKSVVRRIRPQEAEQLAVIDAEIAQWQNVIATLRTTRKALVAEAWTKAHVVRLSELEIRPDWTPKS